MTAAMGRPVADLDDFLEAPTQPVIAPATLQPMEDDEHRRSRRWWWPVAAAVAALAATASLWTLRDGASMMAEAPPPAAEIPPGVHGFAEMYIATFLASAGSEGALRDYLPAAPILQSMVPATRYVTQAAAISIDRIDEGYWAVIVAADVLLLSEGGYRPTGVEHYRVAVVDDGGRFVAAALPSRVADPPTRPNPPRSLLGAGRDASPQEAALLGDFAEALLTDSREITRYVSSNSGIRNMSPAPYRTVTVTDTGTFADGSLRLTVDATDAAGTVTTLHYFVEVDREGPALVVSAVTAGPPQAGD